MQVIRGNPCPNLHPTAGEAQFIPRLGYMQQRLLPLLAQRGVRITTAPLYYVGHNPQLALFAPRPEVMGLALDPYGHHRQVPPQDRSAAYRKLPYGGGATAFDPDRDAIAEPDLIDLAITPLELQRAAGATLLLTLAHLTGGIGTRGRDMDLVIARTAIAHFRRQRMDEPPEHAVVAIRREVYASVAVRAEALASPAAIRRLADAYLALDADGFWVTIEGFDEKASRSLIRASGMLLGMLRDDGRPVVSVGAGQLHLGMLVNEISTSVGLAEGERFALPPPRSENADLRRARSAYHPRYLRSFRVGEDAAIRAFGTSKCRCQRHPPNAPPTGEQVAEHAAIVRVTEGREAVTGDIGTRREWLLANAAMASHLAHDAGVEWTKGVVFEALFEGIDDSLRRQQPAHG